SWEEDGGDNGRVKFTYLGTAAPSGVVFREENDAWYQYQGYYEIVFPDGERKYAYYPKTGGRAHFSDPLD
ncbi:MAG: hypothetical protein LBD08_06935, partial [Treponema sp.]|nr:hypothetical protein [Treponema sp.]